MTGTNHAITGAIIGSVVASPALALPLAFLSHFVLDALPHYGEVSKELNRRRFLIAIALDTLAVLALLLYLIVQRPSHWIVAALGALLAMSPDIMWLPNFIRGVRKKAERSHNILMSWHDRIQREHVWGIFVEAAWLLAMLPLLLHAASPS